MNVRCWFGWHPWDYAKTQLTNTKGRKLWFRTRRCQCGRFDFLNDLQHVPTWQPVVST